MLEQDNGILTHKDIEKVVKSLMKAMTQHRVWEREPKTAAIPA